MLMKITSMNILLSGLKHAVLFAFYQKRILLLLNKETRKFCFVTDFPQGPPTGFPLNSPSITAVRDKLREGNAPQRLCLSWIMATDLT